MGQVERWEEGKVGQSAVREWEERPGLVQEKSPTGHSCNPRTEPSLPLFEFRAGLKVEDGYAVGKRGFPRLPHCLM